MLAAFKLLPIAAKIGIIVGILIALAGIIGGAYYGGYTKGSARADTEILAYQNKVKDLNTKLVTEQGKVTTKIVTEYKDRVQVVTQIKTQNHDVIVDKVVPTFVLTKGWVYAYNQTALGEQIDPALAADTTPSGVSDAKGLLTLSNNNSKYYEIAARLTSLQNWVKAQEMINEKIGHSGSSSANSVQPETTSSGSGSNTVSTTTSSTDGSR